MLKKLLTLPILVLSLFANAQTVASYDATKYVLVDGKLLRGNVGYSMFTIGDVDTLPDREAHGVNLRIEARLISGFLKEHGGFVLADAFFLDLTMGTLKSEPLYYYDNPEDRFSSMASFGYSVLAGYSTERFGALAGKGVKWSSTNVGDSWLPGAQLFSTTAPWMLRLEGRPAFSNEFRVMVTAWDNFNSAKRDQGFRVDIPIAPRKRFFLTYEYGRRTADVSYVSFDNGVYAPGSITQHMVGFRFGSIY